MNKGLLLNAFVDLLRTSGEPELVNMRNTLQDDSAKRDTSFDGLRKYNSFIFIKDRSAENPLFNPPKYTES